MQTSFTYDCTAHFVHFAYKFTGKERDTESGLDYFGARYYASTMGRWMSPDWSTKEEPVPYSTLDDPQSLNLYGYVRNNPLSRVDIDGHCTPGDWGCNPWSADNPRNAWNLVHGIARAPAQQQNSGSTSNSRPPADPIVTALQSVPRVDTVTSVTAADPKGGHANDDATLTFKTPADKAKLLAESRRKHWFQSNNSEYGLGEGIRLPGGLHVERGHLDVHGNLAVRAHIDRFNANNGLAPLLGHLIVDVAYGSLRYPTSAGLDR